MNKRKLELPPAISDTKRYKKTTSNKNDYLYETEIDKVSELNLDSTEDDIIDSCDFSNLKLKPDHENRPLWVCMYPPDLAIVIKKDKIEETAESKGYACHILLEVNCPLYQKATDFLVAVAEPVSRPSYIHEYRITKYSLYAAVSMGILPEDILHTLNYLSKVEIETRLCDLILDWTKNCGKARLILKNSKYYIESSNPSILRDMLNNNEINAAKLNENSNEFEESDTLKELSSNLDVLNAGEIGNIEEELESAKARKNYSFPIKSDQETVEKIKQICNNIYPMIDEYDFRKDTKNPCLPIDLRSSVYIRPYQEKSLSKMFGNGRGRSGVVVLPCGAGKTLVGIVAASTIKKSCLCVCTATFSVNQWVQQFYTFSTIPQHNVIKFTADEKHDLPKDEAVLLVTTYSMLSFSGHRGADTERILEEMRNREWGLLILDEVHVAPASTFRRITSSMKCHCKLGLTATLVREDNLISDLNYLVGPKLYEANWMELTDNGFLSKVQCVEIWCEMEKEFYKQYIRSNERNRNIYYVMNPNKIHACEYLVKYHEKQGDKILVFCDNIIAIRLYSLAMKRPFIDGSVGERERESLFQSFRENKDLNTLFISRVGDTSIDLPQATVLIQVASHFSARRQEAQRLGRILRPKKGCTSGYNAYFYSLVSTYTKEMYYATRRQKFLLDQGYSFEIKKDLMTEKRLEECKLYKSNEEIKKLLLDIEDKLSRNKNDKNNNNNNNDNDNDNTINISTTSNSNPTSSVRRTETNSSALSGGRSGSFMINNNY